MFFPVSLHAFIDIKRMAAKDPGSKPGVTRDHTLHGTHMRSRRKRLHGTHKRSRRKLTTRFTERTSIRDGSGSTERTSVHDGSEPQRNKLRWFRLLGT